MIYIEFLLWLHAHMSTLNSPIVSIFFKLVGVVLFLNRILYTIQTHKNMAIERDEDIYLKTYFCDKVDHSEIGRHTTICLEADKRLASSVVFHTIQEVVNDTLYRELQFQTLVYITTLFTGVIIVGAIHSKYIKDHRPMNLPTYGSNKLGIKID
jgi:hypothetical protein